MTAMKIEQSIEGMTVILCAFALYAGYNNGFIKYNEEGADLRDTNLRKKKGRTYVIQTCGGSKWPMAHAPFCFLLLTVRWRLETGVDLHDTNLG